MAKKIIRQQNAGVSTQHTRVRCDAQRKDITITQHTCPLEQRTAMTNRKTNGR